MKTINKDTLIEIKKTKSKFLSIIIIMFLGVLIFVGLMEMSPTMKRTYNNYLKNGNMYDFVISNSFGLSDNDIQQLTNSRDIEKTEKYYIKNFLINGNAEYINVESYPELLATPTVIKGRKPIGNDEVVVTESLINKYNIGDKIKFTDYKKDFINSISLSNKEYTIVGFVNSVTVPENSTNNPSNTSYFAYVNIDNFKSNSYSGIKIKYRDLTSDYSSEEYENKIESKRIDLINLFSKQREEDEKTYKNEKYNQINNAKKEVVYNLQKLNSAKEELIALKNINEEEYNHRIVPIEENIKKLESSNLDIEKNKDKLEELIYPRFNVESIKSNSIYSQIITLYKSFVFLAYVFSLFLFAVAILVSLTTLTRMIDENRTNIGTLKSLGYTNFEISKKYYIYGISSTLLGFLLGSFAAYKVIVPLVYKASAGALTFNVPIIKPSIIILLAGLGVSLICIILSIFFPLKKSLKENSSILLRPKAPKTGKYILLEKITPLWRRLSFLRKVTFRNIFRYKIRMFMTIFGIVGCITLMFIGFGIRYSMIDISNEQFKLINKLNVAATYNPDITNENKEKISKLIPQNLEKTELSLQKATVENNGVVLDTISLMTFDNIDYSSYFTILDKDRKKIEDYTGVIIDEKLAYLHNIKVGDEFNIFVNDKEYTVKVSGINLNYFGHIMYMSKDYYEKIFNKEYKNNTFIIKGDDNNQLSEVIKELKQNDDIVNILDNLEIQDNLDRAIKGLNSLVIVMVLCSVSLALVVLYNLININISERLRELSTVKVLGFYSREVTAYIFREIFYLSVIGIIMGNYVGYNMYKKIILELSDRAIMYSTNVSDMVYILSSGITITIILGLMIFMHFRLKKVNMVESLKAVE